MVVVVVVGDDYRPVAYHGSPRKATGGHGRPHGDHGRPRETAEASSRTQILVPVHELNPLPAPPGPLKQRLFGEKEMPPRIVAGAS